jgi:hypothetical protein
MEYLDLNVGSDNGLNKTYRQLPFLCKASLVINNSLRGLYVGYFSSINLFQWLVEKLETTFVRRKYWTEKLF